MSVTINYKNDTLATFRRATKTLTTKGKFLEDDISITDDTTNGSVYQDDDGYVVINDEAGSGLSLLPLNITENGTYQTNNEDTGYSPVTVNVHTDPTLQSKSVNPTESSQTVKPDTNYDGLSQVTVGAISNTYVGSSIPRMAATNLTVSGSTITTPSGYYASAVSKNVAGGTATTPGTSVTTNPTITLSNTTGVITASYNATKSITPTVTAGYISAGTAGTVRYSGTATYSLSTQAAKTVTPTETAQTVVSSGYFTTGDVKVAGISSNYVGTNVTRISAADMTHSGGTVTAPSGYYASALTHAVGNGTATTPATTLTFAPAISVDAATGKITATVSGSSNITPTVTAGYVNAGTAGKITVSGSKTLTMSTKAGTTITPTETAQTVVASGYYTLGAVKVAGISSTYIGTNVPKINSASITANGATVNMPSGYYSSALTHTIGTGVATVSYNQLEATGLEITLDASAAMITANLDLSLSVTPTVTPGYISAGTKGTVTATGYRNYILPSVTGTTITPTEAVQTAVASGKFTMGDIKVAAISSTYVGTGVTTRSSANLTVNGATVTAPAGYYSAAAAATVATATQASPTVAISNTTGKITATLVENTGYITGGTTTGTLQLTSVAGTTITPTEAQQTAVARYRWTKGSVYVAGISSTYVGTGVPTGSAANLTADGSTVTVPSGYYSSQVAKNIGAGAAITPATTLTFAPAISIDTATGKITATVDGSSNITPTITAGYVAAGTSGKITVTGISSYTLTIQAAKTITPTETAQTAVASGRYTTGAITVAKISSTYVGTGVTKKSAVDIILNDEEGTIEVPAGYYSVTADYALPLGGASIANKTVTFTPAITVSSNGKITATVSGSTTVTPTTTGGYISNSYIAPSGTVTISGSKTLTLSTTAAATITPTTASQLAVSSGYYTTGSVYVGPIPDSYVSKSQLLNVFSARTITNSNNTATELSAQEALFSSITTIASGAFCKFKLATGSFPNVYTIMDYAFFFLQSAPSVFDFPKATQIAAYAFYSNTLLTGKTINIPNVSYIYTNAFASCNMFSNINAPSASTINTQAFQNATSLITVSLPLAKNIPIECFNYCSNLTTVYAPTASLVNSSAFYKCSKLTDVTLTACTSISSGAFRYCNSLSEIVLPSCDTIGSYAFAECSSLQIVNAPNCTKLSANCFASTPILSISMSKLTSINGGQILAYCSLLSQVNFPILTSLPSGAFFSCISLSSVNIPECNYIGSSCFRSCHSLTSISIPKCSVIEQYAFYNCDNLTVFSIASTCSSIGSSAFYSCYKLSSVYIHCSSVPTLGVNVFYNSPMQLSTYLGTFGSIYVKSSLLASFKTATNWSTYSARMVGF